jgi:hypothetical protein
MDALRALSLGRSQAPEKVSEARERADAKPSIAVGARIALPRLVPDQKDLEFSRSCHAPDCHKPICLQCSRCLVARYCSQECANRDAPQHKHICRPKVGDTPALASACIGVVEGIDGDRIVVKLDSGPRVIIGAESIASRDVDSDDAPPVGAVVELQGLASAAFNGRRGVVTTTPPDVAAVGRVVVVIDGRSIAIKRANVIFASDAVADASSDVWFREEAFVNILSFLDGRTLARFVLTSRRADVRRRSWRRDTKQCLSSSGGLPQSSRSLLATSRRGRSRWTVWAIAWYRSTASSRRVLWSPSSAPRGAWAAASKSTLRWRRT